MAESGWIRPLYPRNQMTSSDKPDEIEALPVSLEKRFSIESVLGKGAYGAVYLAKDRELGRKVAIKTLLPNRSHGESLERFHREAKIASQLNNPHLVQVFDFGTTPEQLEFIIYEFIDGKSCLLYTSPSPRD